jgi:chromosome segregation protein
VFLKSIDLFGFKSFADKSRIEFTGGISALLGPNGCGKSNVVDAIKWVLGEQATKSLRADRMEDVIFNGTDSRKALNVAEVTLTLLNDTGILSLDMPEITVKRRLYRSGESEYFINGAPVKLKELRELFYDTGIGKSSYSIMEQGKIDQILSNKPEERRHIFEEAAGITRFKVRAREAERKLERTEENVRQVESVLQEVRRSHDSLKKQAEKTEEYRELRRKLMDEEIEIQLLKLKSLLDDKAKREREVGETTEKRDTLKRKIDALAEELEEGLEAVNTMESRLVESQKRLYGVEVEKSAHAEQIRVLAERKGEMESSLEALVAREETVKKKLVSLKQDIDARQKEVNSYEQSITENQSAIDELDRRVQEARQEIRENKERISAAEHSIADEEKREGELQVELRAITDDIVAKLDAKLRESGYSASRRRELEAALQEALGSARVHLSGRRDLMADHAVLDRSQGQLRSFLSETGEVLDSVVDTIRRVEELFGEYRSANPAFLDEFLAPEGIITKKRDIDSAIEESRRSVVRSRKEIGELNETNGKLSSRIDEFRKRQEELRLNLVEMRTQKTNLEKAIQQARREIGEQEEELKKSEQELLRGRERLAQLEDSIAERRKAQEKLGEEENRLRKELKSLEDSINSQNRSVVDKEKSQKKMLAELDGLQRNLEKLQMAAAEIRTSITNLYENFQERYSRDLTEYESRMYEIRREMREIRETASSIRSKLQNLGNVNLMAPEEYAEVKERFEFLSGQLEDLQKARQDLLKVTSEIQRESEELFSETYNKIRKNFHTMFRRLFGGGRAELRLTNDDDVLASGIDILAQPPGKKLESINLLSGGERSLTAVALLFATYMVRPSPFCLLDEIDAALDENNVGRFVNMLMEFAEGSQFIVITHNKKTVAGASTLLGVTMEESGVSKVVSIRVDGERQAV